MVKQWFGPKVFRLWNAYTVGYFPFTFSGYNVCFDFFSFYFAEELSPPSNYYYLWWILQSRHLRTSCTELVSRDSINNYTLSILPSLSLSFNPSILVIHNSPYPIVLAANQTFNVSISACNPCACTGHSISVNTTMNYTGELRFNQILEIHLMKWSGHAHVTCIILDSGDYLSPVSLMCSEPQPYWLGRIIT